MSETREASIIIASYNRKDDLCECLDALTLSTPANQDVEVIVVDDGSTDGTIEAVRAAYPHVRLLVNERNCGPAVSRNRGSCAARGRLLIYLDSDAVPAPAWLDELRRHDDGHTVLLGCIRDYDGGRIQGGPRRATFIGKSLRCRPDRANTGASCNLAVSRQCFDEIGGFDEEIPYYFEDSDLCIRARAAGYGAKYLEDAVVRHKGSERKLGKAVWMQEHNSTYAMLKRYRGHPVRTVLFTVLNGTWAWGRAATLALGMKGADSRRLLGGWVAAYARFYLGKTPRPPH